MNNKSLILTLVLGAGLAGCAASTTASAIPACPPEQGGSPNPQTLSREVVVTVNGQPVQVDVQPRQMQQREVRIVRNGQAMAPMGLTMLPQDGPTRRFRAQTLVDGDAVIELVAPEVVVDGMRLEELEGAERVALAFVGGDGPTRTMRIKENGREVRIEERGGKVTATINGKAVPASDIEIKDGKVTVKDAQGNVVVNEEWPEIDVKIDAVRGVPAIPPVPPTAGFPGVVPGLTWTGPANSEPPKVMLGITMDEMDEDDTIFEFMGIKPGPYAIVESVPEGLPAAKAGLQPKDIIVSIDGKTPATTETIRDVVKTKKPGETVSLQVVRKGGTVNTTVTLEAFDGDRFKAYGPAMADPSMEDRWRRYGEKMEEWGKNFSREMEEQARKFGDTKDKVDLEGLREKLKFAIPRNGEPMLLMTPDAEGRAKLEERLKTLEAQLQRMEDALRRLESRSAPVAPPTPATGGSGNPAPFYAGL